MSPPEGGETGIQPTYEQLYHMWAQSQAQLQEACQRISSWKQLRYVQVSLLHSQLLLHLPSQLSALKLVENELVTQMIRLMKTK